MAHQSNRQEKGKLYPIAKLTSRLKTWKIKATAEIETDEEVHKKFRNKRWEGRKFAVTLKDDSGEIGAIAFRCASKFESQIQNNKEYYVSGANIEKVKKAFQRRHKYQLVLEEDTLFQAVEDGTSLPQDACSSSTGAASVGSRKTATSSPRKVLFQPLPVNEAKNMQKSSEYFDILGLIKKSSAAQPKTNGKTGRRFYAKHVCLTDKTGEVTISISANKVKELNLLKTKKIIGVVGCYWAANGEEIVYAHSEKVYYEECDIPDDMESKVKELREWSEAYVHCKSKPSTSKDSTSPGKSQKRKQNDEEGKIVHDGQSCQSPSLQRDVKQPRKSPEQSRNDVSHEKRGTKRPHEEQEHGSKKQKLNFKKFEELTKIGRNAFQFYFDTVFPTQDFSKFLIDNKDTMQFGRGGSKFTEEEMNVLFPGKNSTATSSKLDVTVMYRLVRNYGVDIPSPTKGWGKKPDICKKEIGDDLERIRSYRNKVKHATEETDVMDEDDFDIQWNDLKQAIVRLSGGRLKKEIMDLQSI
ncbi:uncharacterized protein LOC125673832 isoform X2 [Ostrea edulis]|uniref:uncharacterized protein LOC125673832 isoform X2 n=1 Tax=Ostrea edulis TaxID=37623 RepID=UPI0024AFBA76|nr:uncharacterized protein LOC125673832 isoform X2 [Ostrea edulis]XP_056014097.1 uncharacterized protein LOC125673832 isoform X2 [Ostrea edulis]